MVHSFRVGALVAILACAAPGWGQMQPDSFVTVREEGKPAVKCRVVKCWKEKDGSRVCQVQAVTTGEMMTIVEGGAGSPASSPRVFSWGKSKTSPPGVPVASASAQLVSTWTSATPAEPKGKTGLIPRVFGSSSSAPNAVVKYDIEKPNPADLRQSWGKLEPWTPPEAPKVVQASGRPPLPVARKEGGDPLERPDIYTSAPASMPPIKTESGLIPATPPLPATPAVATKESPKPLPELPASSTVVTSKVSGDCSSCTPATTSTRRPFLSRDFGGSSSPRSGLLGGRFGGSSRETVVVREEKVGVTPPTAFPAGSTVTKVESPKHEVVSVVKEAVRAPMTQDVPEPHVGVLSGLFNPPPPAPAREPRTQRGNLPAGMTSIAAAAQAAGPQGATPVGAIVRLPDGQHRVIDLKQGVGVMLPSMPVNGSNAFTTMAQMPVGYHPDHQTLANAFTLPTPLRPLPADAMLQSHVPNGLAGEGMGGAEMRPSLAMAQAMAMGYYYPMPMMMPQPPMMAYAGPAMAAAAVPATAQHLMALRHSLMPSERERAAMELAQCNWKGDPQVVPALVLAAQTDPAPAVRVSCVRALGQMKAATLPAVQAISALTKDQDVRVRQEAERVLPELTKR